MAKTRTNLAHKHGLYSNGDTCTEQNTTFEKRNFVAKSEMQCPTNDRIRALSTAVQTAQQALDKYSKKEETINVTGHTRNIFPP